MAWARRLPSGRYQSLYRDASGRVRSEGSWKLKVTPSTPRKNKSKSWGGGRGYLPSTGG